MAGNPSSSAGFAQLKDCEMLAEPIRSLSLGLSAGLRMSRVHKHLKALGQLLPSPGSPSSSTCKSRCTMNNFSPKTQS